MKFIFKILALLLLLLPNTALCQSSIGSRKPTPPPIVNPHKPARPQQIHNNRNGSINGHEYVDLGLASGTKWATCNIGAFSPSESGNYYAWGETSRKSYYDHNNHNTRSYEFDNISGSKNFDPARANWGGSWRLPTKFECEELLNNCQWTYDTLNGVRGYKVTGINGNSIFLPLAGFYHEYKGIYSKGEGGLYWSSNQNYDGFGGCSLSYYLGLDEDSQGMHRAIRHYGLSVRPVTN